MTGYEEPLFGPAHERALHEAGEVAVSNAALDLRFAIKQAAAWRMLAELVRRQPRLQILEGTPQAAPMTSWSPGTPGMRRAPCGATTWGGFTFHPAGVMRGPTHGLTS